MRRTVGLIWLAACGPADGDGLGQDFLLGLDVIVADGQAPFGAGTVELSVHDAQGVATYPLGAADAGPWELVDVGPLDDAGIGLAVRDAGGDLTAWGRTGGVTVAAGDATIPVIVPEVGRVGPLGTLPTRSFGAAATVLSDGRVLVFGGSPVGAIDAADTSALTRRGHDDYWTLDRLDVTAELFEAGTMLAVDGRPGSRVAATATAVTHEGRPQAMLVGGRTSWGQTVTGMSSVFRYDPENARFTELDDLPLTRSGHLAASLGNDLLVVGGYVDNKPDPEAATAIVWRAADDAWESLGSLDRTGAIGLAWAPLDDGWLVCGGGVSDASSLGSTLLPTAGCWRITGDGQLTQAASMPAARIGHAMATLADGRVLACGGTAGAISTTTTGPATDTAWLYSPDGDTWSPTVSLAEARAGHAALPVPDGTVLVFGGADALSAIPPVVLGTPTSCGEQLDLVAGTSSPAEPCDTTAAGGVWPVVSSAAGDAAFVLEGVRPNDDGGLSWGLFPLPPASP